MENMMQVYLGDQYNDENHILNWLKYWLKGDCKTQYKNYEEWRIKNDLDCLYFAQDANALYADTIISIWQILTMVLNCQGYGIFKKNSNDIKRLISIIEEDSSFLKHKLTKKLNNLACQAEKRYNYMLLPNRKMQIRGFLYADQLPATLYQCLVEGGCFESFFQELSPQEWILREHLECAFIDKHISLNTIIPIADGFIAKRCIKRTTRQELIMAMLDYSITFLSERKKYYA